MINFSIQSGREISNQFLQRGMSTFEEACSYVKSIVYGRNTDKLDIYCVLNDNIGTCSTKHALLKRLADENGQPSIELVMGIFRMNAQNTPETKKVLSEYGLTYIPEAHNYLKYNGSVIDCTTTKTLNFQSDLLEESIIEPEQITDYKVSYHKQFLSEWLKTAQLPYTLDEIWTIREKCIAVLGQ